MNRFAFFIILILQNWYASAQQKMQHISTASNISNNSTFINAEGLNNNPNAIIIVEYDAATAKANPHAVGVWYNGSQWAIFNQDRAAMIAGLTFNLTWKNTDANAYAHKVVNGITTLDHPSINNNPSASFYASQVWNPGGVGGVYNNADITVSYNQQTGKWSVANINNAMIPEGAAFNILVTGGANIDGKASTTIGGKTPAIGNIPAIINQQTVITPPKGGNPNNQAATNPAIVNIDNTVIQAATSSSANLGFEDLFLNWNKTGTAFNFQPVSGNTVTTNRVLGFMNYSAGGIGGDYWKGMPYNIGHKGNSWIGTYEHEAGDAPTGTLTSKPIIAEKRFLTFLLGGGNDINKIYVELQVKKADYEAAWGAGKKGLWGDTEDGFTKVNRVTPAINSEDLYRYYFDLNSELNNQFAGKIIRIRIVDEKTAAYGHINVDDFLFKDNLNEFISFTKNGFGLLADKDKPVWGFADTHAHWVNHVGLNNFMWGSPGGKLETSDVKVDIPPCDGFNHGLPTITPGLLLAQTESKAFNRFAERLADPGNATCAALLVPCVGSIIAGGVAGTTTGLFSAWATGASAKSGVLDATITNLVYAMVPCPSFHACGYQFAKDVFAKHYGNNVPADRATVSNYVDFPAWNSFAHQTMHISWVRRSFDGGQRLMVVPVGVAKSWEFNASANGVMQDAIVHIRSAVSALKELVRLNSGWLQVAYTANEAREIILQNKMAIIIGVEQAEIGSYYPGTEQEVNELYALGIRHFFPIHNINNSLGGAAVFNSDLNSYNDLVNRKNYNGAITPFQIIEGFGNSEKSVSVKLKRSFKRQEMRLIPIAGFGTIPFLHINDVPVEYHYQHGTAHKNVYGLSQKGKTYLKALMKKGVLIDIDHMSDRAQDTAVFQMNKYGYPLLSGHTNFRDLRRLDNETDGDTKEARLKTEFTIYNSRASDIIRSGGMFGVMNQQNNIRDAKAGCPVDNTSAGGSSSFIQGYWYALQKGGEDRGIAFGSDANGFAPQVSPRFGTDAVYFLEGDEILNRQIGNWDKDKQRRRFAFLQTKGVRYDKPISTWHYHRFQPTGFLTQEERDIWEALAMAKSGVDITNAWQPGGGFNFPERTDIQRDKIKNIAHGFRWGILREPTGDYGAFLECPDYLVRDENLNNCMPERKAAYLCIRGETSLPAHMITPRTRELYNIMLPIYRLWLEFENGPNEPLRRSYVGTRDFDFNLDGQAHYGMLPDLIQDIKNQGLTTNQLKPLFLGAEQYIKMWEQAQQSKNNIQD